MFRISKSDDHSERRDPESEKADREPSPQGSGNGVTTSALRWLGGSHKLDRPVDDVVEPLEPELPDEGDLADDLELTSPLDDDDLDEEDEDDEGIASSEPALALAATRMEIPSGGALFPGLYDDNDDFDDFDDLFEIRDVTSPAIADEASALPEIGLDDFVLPDLKDDGSPTFPATLDEPEFRPADADDAAPPAEPPEVGETLAAEEICDLVDTEPSEASMDEPMVDDRLEDETSSQPPPDQVLQDEPLPSDVPSHGELENEPSANSLDTSLALQPIPELQTKPRFADKTSSERSVRKDDWIDALDDGDAATNGMVLSDEDDDDLDVEPSDAAFPEITSFDIEELEIESLDLHGRDQVDDQADDWHAHLADVLGATGEEPEAITETSKAIHETKQPSSRQDDPPSILPLSKTLTQLATSSPPTISADPPKDDASLPDDSEDPVPSLPIVTARQKMAASEPSSMLPVEMIAMPAEHLPLAIIANLPRLRRFAVAQIGDELEADRLVQTTMEAALADMSVLRSDRDLGVALMMLLYQQRRDMLNDLSTPKRSPEAARAFETVLCRGLAGADQFEIHEFARAINSLEEQDRELLILVALENLSYDQIADLIQVPAGQVMVKISSVRMRLRRALAADDATEESGLSAIAIPHAQEIDINGYLDGELDGRHMADIDALVEYDEDAADRLLRYGIQGDLIRRLYAPLINRPVPSAMLAALSAAAKPARRGFRFGPRRALIAGATIIALTAATIWPHIGPALNGLVSDAMAISSTSIAER